MSAETSTRHDGHIRISDSPEPRLAPNENWQARRELAAQLRRLNRALLTTEIPTDRLRALTAQLDHHAHDIENRPRIFGREALIQREQADLLYEVSPAIGQANAMAIPLHIWRSGDGRVHGTFTPDWSHEGPFGYLHGGVIALLFDQFLGVAQHAANTGGGRTGTLTIRYHHPTPLNEPLRLEGHLKRVDGRKKFIVAELRAGDVRTASCEAVFVGGKSKS